jgi:uncharacterized protein involved in outer membrane biogenesis
MKIVLSLFVVIVIAVVAGGFYIANNMNGLVKDAVEDVGSQVLKTSVTLKAVNIQLLQGKAKISGLTIANPQGFDQPHVFQMDNIAVELDLASLIDRVVNVKEVTIDGANVIAEQKGLGTNLQALMKNLEGSPDSSNQTVAEDGSSSPEILIKVGLFQFINSSTNFVSEKWGEKQVSIPDIKLTKLGGEQGLPPEKLAETILKPVLKQLNKAIESRIKELFEGKLKGTLEEKEDELKKKLSDKLSEKLGDDANGNMDSLKSLLSR